MYGHANSNSSNAAFPCAAANAGIALRLQSTRLAGWVAEVGALDRITHMAKPKLKVGDKIRVTGYRPGKDALGVVDDMGTEELLKSMVGRRYVVRGFDDHDNIELRPKPLHTVWIEPDLVESVRRPD